MILKKVSKVVAMSLLMVSMLGENVSAATYHTHTWVKTGNPYVNSWYYTHDANTDGWYCRVDCWVSSTYEQCSVCGLKQNEVFMEHGRHSDCIEADYDVVIN